MEPNNNNPQSEESVNTQMDNTYLEEKRSFINIIKTKKVALGLVALVALFAISAFAYILMSNRNISDEETEVIIEEARKAYNTGDLQLVRSKLEEAYNKYPNDPGIQAALIKTIASQGNLTGTEVNSYTRAQEYAEKALKDNPDNTEVLLSVGYLEETAENYENARFYYEKAVALDSENPTSLFHLGHVLEFLNRQDEAFDYYERAYALDKNSPLITMGKARKDLMLGNSESARQLYISASQLPNATNIEKSEALTNASVLSRNNESTINEAINLSRQATELSSQFSPAYAIHGFNLAMLGNNPNEGIKYLLKSIELNPRISNNYWQLGLVYRATGDYENAIKYQEEGILRLDEDNTILGEEQMNRIRGGMLYDLAQTFYWNRQDDRVLALLNDAVSFNPLLKEKLQLDYSNSDEFSELISEQELNQLIQ